MSPITSTPTTPSLDAFSDADYSLLSESLTLDTISILSLESTPPFPCGGMVPLSTVLTVNDNPYIAARSRPDKVPAITTTIPTPPRLRTLLKQNLCISSWTEGLVSSDAPGHIPWGDIQGEGDGPVWKPEGSLYPSEAFQKALSDTRSRKSVRAPTSDTIRRPSTNSNNARNRNALVFEREITLETEGKTKRWSVQVPATSMNPDLRDMMVELRNLNAYFKEEDEEVEVSPSTAAMPVETVHPPSLIVSTSQCAIPLSLESAGSLHTFPQTLASRRGNKNLPPLKVQLADSPAYSSIPTAFLGSPSSYCPTFEFTGSTKSPAAFQDMIDSLRSQCASLQVTTPSCAAFSEEQEFTSKPSSRQPEMTPETEDDEWAFAHSLLEKFTDFVHEPGVVNVEEADPKRVTQDFKELLADITLVNDLAGPAEVAPSTNEASSIAPPSPSLASNPSPTLSSSNSPRGILKRCKSVRFAESPCLGIAPDTTSVQEVSTPPLVRHSVGPSAARTLKRPSPLRHTYAPQASTQGPSPSSSRQKPLSTGPAPRPIAPKPSAQAVRRVTATKSVAAPQINRESKAISPVKQQQQPTKDTSGSLGRSVRNTLISGKENKKLRGKASFSSNRHTMDENSLRRASTNPPEGQKSRMPVPLRNIFTRFK